MVEVHVPHRLRVVHLDRTRKKPSGSGSTVSKSVAGLVHRASPPQTCLVVPISTKGSRLMSRHVDVLLVVISWKFLRLRVYTRVTTQALNSRTGGGREDLILWVVRICQNLPLNT